MTAAAESARTASSSPPRPMARAVRMTLFNADGSRAEMSGNGIRCFAQAVAAERGQLDDLLVHTDAGDRTVTMHTTDEPDTIVATVDMGDVARIDRARGLAHRSAAIPIVR